MIKAIPHGNLNIFACLTGIEELSRSIILAILMYGVEQL
jgi:hypothetical protein